MSNEIHNPFANLASAVSTTQDQPKKGQGNWFESMADAWGEALDAQARMSFMSNSSHTSLTSVANALESLAKKQ